MFRKYLAVNKYINKKVQLFLAEYGNDYIKEVLAYNDSVDVETMRILANNSYRWVRVAVYNNAWKFPELWRHNV